MENVEGLLTAQEGYFIVETLIRFLQVGYWLVLHKPLMSQYGVPQSRKRVFIIGNLEECNFRFPPPFCNEEPDIFFSHKPLSVLDAIDDLPPPADDPVHYGKLSSNHYQEYLRRKDAQPVTLHNTKPLNGDLLWRIQNLRPGQSMKDLPPDLQHPSFRRRAYRRVMDGTPTERRGGPPAGLKRLDPSKPSLTITSGSPSEFVHPFQNRFLTLRECARIQSFPDDYDFIGTRTQIATQIANAIPPIFMRLLINHIFSLASFRPARTSHGRLLSVFATKSLGTSPVLGRMLANLEEKLVAYT